MSKTEEINLQIKDEAALQAACRELKLASVMVRGTVQLYAESVPDSIAITLPGWRYPLAINTKTGVVKYDNHLGNWGDIKEVNKLKQLYATHAAIIAARKKGLSVQRTTKSDGTIKLQVTGAM